MARWLKPNQIHRWQGGGVTKYFFGEFFELPNLGEVSFHVVIYSSNWFETTSLIMCWHETDLIFGTSLFLNLTPAGSSKLHNGPVHRRLSRALKTGKGSPDLWKCPLHVNWLSRWWFQLFSIFTPTWGSDPIWLMCFSTGWFNHQPVLDSNWF